MRLHESDEHQRQSRKLNLARIRLHLLVTRFEEGPEIEADENLDSQHQNSRLVQHIFDFVCELGHRARVNGSVTKSIGFSLCRKELFGGVCGYSWFRFKSLTKKDLRPVGEVEIRPKVW